jgi:pimeloyl-ACP methyl ester carboxylesterase
MSLTPSALPAQEHVVLLHGLARSARSMHKMEVALQREGYIVHNLDYDSRHHKIEQLAKTVGQQIRTSTESAKSVHIVTHSLGGILVRQIQATAPIPNLGRVVMLSPPNQGSEIVDTIGDWRLFEKINGPAGEQLGTSRNGFIKKLPAIDFDCGILTGDRSINWINSLMIPGKDDGKVSVTSARVEGMSACKVVHATHPFIMKKKAVIEDVIHFLKHGMFQMNKEACAR